MTSLLKYLLKNNPEEVMSKNGILVRKAINPLFRKIMMLFTTSKLNIVHKEEAPKDKKIIYAATHGFHDDIILSMKTTNDHSYLLYGSLLDFFGSFHGIGLWVNGVVLVDRKNKQSRMSAVDKMVHAQNLGANIIMFPESTWNKTESLIVQKLYGGIYDVAEKTGALVVPIATIEYDKQAYSNQGAAFDITKIDYNQSVEIIKNQLKKLSKVNDLLIYSNMSEGLIKERINRVLNKINDIELTSLEENEKTIKFISNEAQYLLDLIEEILNQNEEKNTINTSIFQRSKTILKAVKNQRKIVALEYLRDKMATLKYELYQKGNIEEFGEGYWEEYVNNLIKTTNGLYDHEIEDIAEYKDPEEYTFEQVFEPITKIEPTQQNAKCLLLKR